MTSPGIVNITPVAIEVPADAPSIRNSTSAPFGMSVPLVSQTGWRAGAGSPSMPWA